jgi:hypothetical protein
LSLSLPPIPASLPAPYSNSPPAPAFIAAYAANQRQPLAKVVNEVQDDGLDAAAFRADARKAPTARSWHVRLPRQQRLFAGLALLAGTSFPRDAALALEQLSSSFSR